MNDFSKFAQIIKSFLKHFLWFPGVSNDLFNSFTEKPTLQCGTLVVNPIFPQHNPSQRYSSFMVPLNMI